MLTELEIAINYLWQGEYAELWGGSLENYKSYCLDMKNSVVDRVLFGRSDPE